MLSHKLMGLLALWILWVNTLLIAAAAAKQVAAVLRWAKALGTLSPGAVGVGLLFGRVQTGLAGHHVIARYELAQRGRAGALRGSARTIQYADCAYAGHILGGVVLTQVGPVQVPAAIPGEVWPAREELVAAAACTEQAHFAKKYEEARRARGYSRTVAVQLCAEQFIFVAGELRASPKGYELAPTPALGNGILISATDPRRWVRSRLALGLVFIGATILGASLVTALSLYPPAFGRVSTLGALLGLGFFLGIQPLGTALRDALRPPSRAPVRGHSIEPSPASAASSQPDARH